MQATMNTHTQRSITWTRRDAAGRALATVLTLGLLAALALASPGFAKGPPAAFTTWVDPLGCLDSPNGVNCNNYRAKPDVYMDGGPVSAALDDGTYFFAVLTPGEQNGGFLDGARGNLSDTAGGPGFTAGDNGSGDDVSNRTFSVAAGVITYPGSHATGTNPKGHFVIQLMPYDDTDNPGGVYILAVCAAGAASPSDCKYDAFHVQHPAAPPHVMKDAAASFDREYKWTIKKEVDHLRINEASGGSATFNYTVTASHDEGTDKNWQVNGTITVHNSNADAITGVDVTDAVNDPNATCTVTGGTGLTVDGGASVALSYACTYSAAPANPTETNTATITWPAQDLSDGPLAEGSASFALLFSFPASPNPLDGCVTVTDPNAPANPLGTACVGTDDNPKAFTYAHTFSGDPGGTCTRHDNTATFTANTTGATGSASLTVKVCVGQDLTVSKTATPAFTRTYNWSLAKNVDRTLADIAGGGAATFNYTVGASQTGFTDSGWQVSGTITVTNPNDWEAITANVADAVNDGGSCVVTGGTGASVPAGGSVSLPYACTYASAPNPSSGTNTATATWDKSAFSTPDGSATGTKTFAFTTPTSTVNKTVTVTDTFNGTAITLTTLGTLTATDAPPFASATYTYSHAVSGVGGTCTSYSNTARIAETGQTAGQTVKVCVGLDLRVSKTAATSFTRTFHWGITKAVDKTQVSLVHSTDAATFNYTVNVTHDAGTDSNWQVNGTITVTNPNDWEAITANVADAVNDGGSCVVTGGNGATVPAGGAVSLPYTCTYALAPNPSSGANTATATWDRSAFFTPDGSAQGNALFAFTAPTTVVDSCVAVTDSLFGPLGAVCSTDPSPKTFTYSLNFPAPTAPPLCVSHTNTAAFVTNTTATTGAAGKTVNVCRVPVPTGALTMGFWQNKNGQGILTGGSSTSGVCNSGTWLRRFAPYQDLSPTATCGQVAAYVTSIIKAANAAGSSMNPMLKAQMLATALDVYFSDPALGGNKIAASTPIGGVDIDLTLVCQMIDGSGTATCGGTFESSSAAFGGATHLTVSQMIAYAASQSSTGGGTWYANVKATQQLAKDAFDAINNQVAFAF
jgi:hypothetical protein